MSQTEKTPTLQTEALAAQAEWNAKIYNGPAYRNLFRTILRVYQNYADPMYEEYLSLEFHRAVLTYKPGVSFPYYLSVIIRNSHDREKDIKYNNRVRALSRGIAPEPEDLKMSPHNLNRVWNPVNSQAEETQFIRSMRAVYVHSSRRDASRDLCRDGVGYSRPSMFQMFLAGLSGAAQSLWDVLRDMEASDGLGEWSHLFLQEAVDELSTRYSAAEVRAAVRELAELIDVEVDTTELLQA